MNPGNRSLLDFVDTPVLVGDADGRAVYVNPAFESDFLMASEDVVGMPLANLFEGGGREALLRAVAMVCVPDGKQTAGFGLMVGDRGYRALASAVEVEAGRVGVIVVLTRENPRESRLQAFRREVIDSLDELAELLHSLGPRADGAGHEDPSAAVADGLRRIERIRKWGVEVAASLEER